MTHNILNLNNMSHSEICILTVINVLYLKMLYFIFNIRLHYDCSSALLLTKSANMGTPILNIQINKYMYLYVGIQLLNYMKVYIYSFWNQLAKP